jgi:predicted metalloprotease with PDZ domain
VVTHSAAFLVATLAAAWAAPAQTMSFAVSLPQPANHIIHVKLRATGLKGESQDFKMPAWAPGYYRILDFAKNVSNFRAVNGSGHPLAWEQTSKNTWRVAAANTPAIVLNYDVTALTQFVAQTYLNENRAFISAPGLYMHVAGHIQQQPVTVAFELPAGWTKIATGLDPVPGKPNTFAAPDFDVLYDCPTLLGNQEWIEFEAAGRPHRAAIENVPASVDRQKIAADLKRMVEAATRLIGDVPYRHYTFLLMGKGNGGIEHLNSAAIAFNADSLATEPGYRRWLSYVAHEYFHNFNVKRIRPIALGPFDYDRENLTNMLWVSEGLSVYYQDLVLVRAGLITGEQYLEKMATTIGRFENAPGHRYQSAAESSFNTWGSSGVGNDRNTSISYYDNGAMLGALLDLSIRNGSANRKSLDDVMRGVYRKYYQEKKRGFTDAEFRAECEQAAGTPLDEVFSYAATSKEMDYAKYFGYAGLTVESASQEAKGAWLGVNTRSQETGLDVVEVISRSPAEGAGLHAGDRITAVEGVKATPKTLNDALVARKPGDALRLRLTRDGDSRDIDVALGKNATWTFHIAPAPAPSALQTAILKDWLRAQQ